MKRIARISVGKMPPDIEVEFLAAPILNTTKKDVRNPGLADTAVEMMRFDLEPFLLIAEGGDKESPETINLPGQNSLNLVDE